VLVSPANLPSDRHGHLYYSPSRPVNDEPDQRRDIVPRAAPSLPTTAMFPGYSPAEPIPLRPRENTSPQSPTGGSIVNAWPDIVEPTSARSYISGNYPYDRYTTIERPLAPRKPGASVRPRSAELIHVLTLGRSE